MGKPFNRELAQIQSTLDWALKLPIEDLKNSFESTLDRPLFIVGSGGSLSACHFAAMLHQLNGAMAKAITPLDIHYSRYSLRNAAILFISSSGRNTDILFAVKAALLKEPHCLTSLCLKVGNPLGKMLKQSTNGRSFEFSTSWGKDGFLATNSLISFFIILARSYGHNLDELKTFYQNFEHKNFGRLAEIIHKGYSLNVLYGGWGQPIAFDLESKFTEAALGHILLSDYRNFGHGRHYWLAKKSENTAILAIITPEEEKIAEKTLAFVPKNIPIFILQTTSLPQLGCIDLLIKAFELIKQIAEAQGVDPGRPRVPSFGRKLYNLKYESFYLQPTNKHFSSKTFSAIQRKLNNVGITSLDEAQLNFWVNCHNEYLERIQSTAFGSIIFDYDGTLCSNSERFFGPSDIVIEQLHRILEKGFPIGIVTGRGKSVRIDLQKSISKRYWNKVVLGYYNGSTIGLLSDSGLPNVKLTCDNDLVQLKEVLEGSFIRNISRFKLKPTQLTIELPNKKSDVLIIKSFVTHIVQNYSNLRALESNHSIDVVNPVSSKLKIIPYCQQLAKDSGLPINCLAIGDKGKWPGNDHELLRTHFSLSVDEASPDPLSCWNFASVGKKNIDATMEYLRSLHIIDNSIRFR